MNYPKVHFPDRYDERGADEMTMKGWIGVTVDLEQGQSYELTFMDLARVGHEAAMGFASG